MVFLTTSGTVEPFGEQTDVFVWMCFAAKCMRIHMHATNKAEHGSLIKRETRGKGQLQLFSAVVNWN